MKLGETVFLAEAGVENEPLKLGKSCDESNAKERYNTGRDIS